MRGRRGSRGNAAQGDISNEASRDGTGDDHLGGQRRSTNFNNIHSNGETGENVN